MTHIKNAKIAIFLISVAACTGFASTTCADTIQSDYSYMPPGGYIQNKEIAIAVAEVILDSIYGKKTIDREKPLVATLDGEVWTVHGSLPKGVLGGTATIRISKKSGEIISVVHYK